jgi:hypothetical protein
MTDQNGTARVEVVPGTSTKDEFGGVTSTALAETASTAVAAQATASVQARYVLAMKNPRDLDEVRVRLLKECKRPRFAEVARYLKPVGQGVTGPSIRFAEAALRCMGNVMPEVATVYDDTKKRIVRVTVTDLEANLTYSQDVVVEKTVERSKLRGGQQPIAVRTNSNGYKTFIVEATEDDLLNKQAALVSKALRTLALRVLPGDILDECMDQVIATQEARDKADPDAARKRLVDAFVQIGVKPSDIKTYLGHDLAASSPAEISELRAVYAAIRDGEGTWADAVATKLKAKQDAPDAAKQATTKDKVAAAKKAAERPAPAAPGSKPKQVVDVDPETGEIVPPPNAGDAWEGP